MTKQKSPRRGYAVAMVVGLNTNQAVVWSVFSQVVKVEKTIKRNVYETNSKTMYTFHEEIVNALRPSVQSGIRSIILVSPHRSNYTEQFLQHVKTHQSWLMRGSSKASFAEMTGTATTLAEITTLTRDPKFKQIIAQITEKETRGLLELLEKRLSSSNQEPLALYSFEEIETNILNPRKKDEPQLEYLLLTDEFLSRSSQKDRLHRLIQIAVNKHVKTRVVKADSPTGKRLTQFGGIVCLIKSPVI